MQRQSSETYLHRIQLICGYTRLTMDLAQEDERRVVKSELDSLRKSGLC
jgi:hypothetical protein